MRRCPECQALTPLRLCEKDGTPTREVSATVQAQKVDPLIGKVFDERFLVLDKVGKGGMGSVYRARQLTVGREVALKVLNPDLTEDHEAAGRFVREAKVASRLRHPNTIVVFDFGSCDEGLYIVMELLTGESLYQRIRRVKQLPVREAALIGAAVARSLDEAHSLGIVHRDLKPGNIFLSNVHGGTEVVKVLDFGVARFFQDQASRSKESMFETNKPMMVGTLQYMAPEQIRGGQCDARTDLYALGIMLYELILGSRPFDGETPVHTMQRQLEDTAPGMPAHVPESFRRLVARLLAKNPDDRPSSAAEVAITLETLFTTPEIPVAMAPRFTPESRRAPETRLAVPDSDTDDGEDGWRGLDHPADPTVQAEPSVRPNTPAYAAETRARPPGGVPYRSPSYSGDGYGAQTALRDSRLEEAPEQTKPRSGGLVALLVVGVLGLVGTAWWVANRTGPAIPAGATLIIQSEPSRAYVVDAEKGTTLGQTPFTLTAGAKAPRSVIVKADKYRSQTLNLEFPQTGEKKCPVKLVPSPKVRIDALDMPGAAVSWVDRGEELGVTPLSWSVPDEVLASGKPVIVRISKEGFVPREEQLTRDDLANGRPIEVRLLPQLQPKVKEVDRKRPPR